MTDKENTGIGVSNQTFLTTGNFNTSIGFDALRRASNCVGVVAIGPYADWTDINSTGTISIGYQSLNSATSAVSTVAIGYQALSSAKIPYECIAIGQHALSAFTGGLNVGSEIAIGYNSLPNLANGQQNIAIGTSSMASVTTGKQNIGIGDNAMGGSVGSSYNIALGYQAIGISGVKNDNTAVGVLSLNALSTGSDNSALGFKAGYGDGGSAQENSKVDFGCGFLGVYATRHSSIANTIGLTNAWAIGYQAKVATNNCIALGGSGANAVSVVMGTNAPPSSSAPQSLNVVGNFEAIGSVNTNGFILTSPNGTRYKLTVTDAGLPLFVTPP